jgi:hypothetical protein
MFTWLPPANARENFLGSEAACDRGGYDYVRNLLISINYKSRVSFMALFGRGTGPVRRLFLRSEAELVFLEMPQDARAGVLTNR